ncbi:uncharacterized protein LOC100907928 [Galendromus occidentalis]|uniref:Uncharacterized protein LOC100907928 n=1 Tax=Galendromus occidentalis TaxID=34638 RepID=A0AAJ6QQ37_9ACAR|nr:uncharacterized protein LOC100907928 [Galendromus occidentalis]
MERFEGTVVGAQIRRSPKRIVDLWNLSKSEVSTRFAETVVEHFRNNEEPVDLLYDQDVDYRILHRVFRKHFTEILKFLQEFVETVDLDPELRQAASVYINYIEQDEMMIRFGPDPLSLTPLQMILQAVD